MKYRLWYTVEIPNHNQFWRFVDCADLKEAEDRQNHLKSLYDCEAFATTMLPLHIMANDYLFFCWMDPQIVREVEEENRYYDDALAGSIAVYTGTYHIIHKDQWNDKKRLISTFDPLLDNIVPDGFSWVCDGYEYDGSMAEGVQKLKDAGFVWHEKIGDKLR